LEGDWLLQTLVSSVNAEDDFELSITLQTGGLLVSGTLISGRRYFVALAKVFTESGKPGEDYKSISKLGDIYAPKTGSTEKPSFIHLKQAQFFGPGTMPTPSSEGVLWRGRICDVAGFFLGTISTGDVAV
jgi:hypothetical protein